MTTSKSSRITGIGSALVDILINESDQFLSDMEKEKGGMTLVDNQEIQSILSKTQASLAIVPGGAACNTIVGVGNLGGEARFIGKRGKDNYGQLFENQLVACNVQPLVETCDSPTGQVLSVITPDAQRSMFTFLGASTELAPESITPQMFENTAIAMIEGYLLFNKDLMMAALKSAKSAGAMIALDLASFEVVNAAKPLIEDIVKKYVDILIANEDEAKAYTGFDDEKKAINALSENVLYGVLKVGAEGSYVSYNNTITKIEPVRGNPPVDTTGAGDLWAAGFLFGLSHGHSIEKSGIIASACGYEVCQVVGAQLTQETWEKIRKLI